MSKTIRQALLFLPIVAIFIALGYWNIRPESFNDTSAGDSVDSRIDFYVIKSVTRQFQENGALDYLMIADKLEHEKDSDITLMSKPDLRLFRDAQSPWHVRSQSGEVTSGAQQIELIDDVSVKRTDAKSREILLTTSRLSLFPDKDYAETEQAVRIEAVEGVTTGKGMQAYLKEGRMKLLSNVRGQYDVR